MRVVNEFTFQMNLLQNQEELERMKLTKWWFCNVLFANASQESLIVFSAQSLAGTSKYYWKVSIIEKQLYGFIHGSMLCMHIDIWEALNMCCTITGVESPLSLGGHRGLTGLICMAESNSCREVINSGRVIASFALPSSPPLTKHQNSINENYTFERSRLWLLYTIKVE